MQHTDYLSATHKKLMACLSDICEAKQVSLAKHLTKYDVQKQRLEALFGFEIAAVPLIMDEQQLQDVKQFNIQLAGIIKKILTTYNRLLLDGKRELFSVPFYQPVDISQLTKANLVFRSDIIFCNGVIKLLEINSGSSLGGWELDFAEAFTKKVVQDVADFDEVELSYHKTIDPIISHLAQSVNALEKSNKTGNIVLCTAKLDETFRLQLQNYFAQVYQRSEHHKQGLLFICSDKQDLSFDGTGQPLYKGEAADAIMLTEHNYPESYRTKFQKAYDKKLIVYPDNKTTASLGNKFLMALMNCPLINSHLSAKDKDWLHKHLPYTFSFDTAVQPQKQTEQGHDNSVQNSIKMLADNKDAFVLKKADSYKGLDVKIGKDISQHDWHQLLEQLSDSPGWIAQEFCEPDGWLCCDPTGNASHLKTVWSTFLFGDHFGGIFGRALPSSQNSSLINAEKGAFLTLVLSTDVK